jgi:hypothetical protein
MRLSIAFILALVSTSLLAGTAETTQQPGAGGPPDTLAETRKLLADPSLQVRLRAALDLAPLPDEQAIGVLIELLTEVAPEERRQAEQTLQQLAGAWAPNPSLPGDDEVSRKIRRAAWAAWWRTIDGPGLLAAFRQRVLSKEELPAVQKLVEQLGDKAAAQRERAAAALIAHGPKVNGLLRAAAKSENAEQARRAELCLQQIALKDAKEKLPVSAPRLLAARKPPGASAALLAYLAFSENRLMNDEIGKALASLIRTAGKADPAVLEALSDPLAKRRLAAAEALAEAREVKAFPAVRKLLGDADPEVRLRVAVALVNALDKETVPALIDLLAEFPRGQVWAAEDLLQRLAGAKSPAVPWGKDDGEARKQLRETWQAWWKEHGAAVNIADLDKTRSNTGLTVVLESGAAGAGGKRLLGGNRLVALDRTGQQRWQIDNLSSVFDFQLLPGERVLIAEYGNKRITERDLKGNILWEAANLPGIPVNVQRLANGNTFIALYGPARVNGQLMELDVTGKMVSSFTVAGGAGAMPGGGGPGGPAGVVKAGGPLDYVIAGHKLADGKMVCLMYDYSCIWLDATGKELKRFMVPNANGLASTNSFGSIDVTPKGNVLIAQSDNTVVEYDMDGKVVWQAKASGYGAVRLANGNTLVTSVNGGVVELDSAGQNVWHFDPPAGVQVVRARRR